MLVEFAGRSGSGKTSLCRRVGARLDREDVVPVTAAIDGVVGKWLGRCVGASRWSHLAQETFGAAWVRRGRQRYFDCDAFVRGQISATAISGVERFRLTRSWNRKLGAVARGRSQPVATGWTLVDEGPVHFASVLFGRQNLWHPAELDHYLDLIPLPDWIVCVTAPWQITERRLAVRGRLPLPDRRASCRRRYLRQVDQVLLRVARHRRIAPRWLAIENCAADAADLDRLALQVVATIERRSYERLSHSSNDVAKSSPSSELAQPAPALASSDETRTGTTGWG